MFNYLMFEFLLSLYNVFFTFVVKEFTLDEYRSRYLTRTNTEIRIRPVAMQKKQTPPKTEFVVRLFLLLFLFLTIRRMCLTMRSLSKYFQLLWASFLHSRELFAIITGVNNTTTLENTSMSVFTFHF